MISNGVKQRDHLFKPFISPHTHKVNSILQQRYKFRLQPSPSQKENIKLTLRNSLTGKIEGTSRRKEFEKKAKWAKESFSRVVKEFKHRQKVLKEEVANKIRI